MIGILISIKQGWLSLRDFLLVAGADKEEGGCDANDSECGTSVGVAVVALSLGVSLSEKDADIGGIRDRGRVIGLRKDTSVRRCLCLAPRTVLVLVAGNFFIRHDKALASLIIPSVLVIVAGNIFHDDAHAHIGVPILNKILGIIIHILFAFRSSPIGFFTLSPVNPGVHAYFGRMIPFLVILGFAIFFLGSFRGEARLTAASSFAFFVVYASFVSLVPDVFMTLLIANLLFENLVFFGHSYYICLEDSECEIFKHFSECLDCILNDLLLLLYVKFFAL